MGDGKDKKVAKNVFHNSWMAPIIRYSLSEIQSISMSLNQILYDCFQFGIKRICFENIGFKLLHLLALINGCILKIREQIIQLQSCKS